MVVWRSQKVIVATALIAVGLAVTALTLTGAIPLSSAFSWLGISGASRTFTIIATADGYNNSHSLASDMGLGVWPVMNVSRCDHVTIKVVNGDN